MNYAQIAAVKYRSGGCEALREWINAAESGPEIRARQIASAMWLDGCGRYEGVIE
jgi:hypothetical protein